MSEGEAAAGLTLSLNQNHRNFGAWQKSFQTDQGTDLDSWGLGVQGLKVICRLTCMRDSCSVDGTCQKPPPGHHCSEVQKGPPPTQNGRQRAQPPLTEGTRATKLHHHQTSRIYLRRLWAFLVSSGVNSFLSNIFEFIANILCLRFVIFIDKPQQIILSGPLSSAYILDT